MKALHSEKRRRLKLLVFDARLSQPHLKFTVKFARIIAGSGSKTRLKNTMQDARVPIEVRGFQTPENLQDE